MQASTATDHPGTAGRPRTVGDVMSRSPVSIRADQSLAVAHGIMRSRGVRHLPVVDDGRIVGIVSQGDLRLMESTDRIDLTRVQVEEAMTQRPYVVGQDEPLASALRVMIDRRIGAVLVAERGRLLGIFTAVDAMAALRRVVEDHDR